MITAKSLADSTIFNASNNSETQAINTKVDKSALAGTGGAALIGTAGGITVEAAIGNKTDSAVFSTAISSLSASINAKVSDAIGTSTTIAPSQNAVLGGLVPKVNTSDLAVTSATGGSALVGFGGTTVYPESSLGRYFTRQVSLATAPFNAPLDGVSDSTVALNSWLTQAGPGTELILPPGDFLFSTSLNFGAVDKIRVTGSGKKTTRLLYTGSDTTVNMVTFGADGTPTHVDLSGFCVDRLSSASAMTSGYAIVLRDAIGGWSMREVTPGSTAGAAKIFNGVLLSNPNLGTFTGYEFIPLAKGIVLIGKAGGDTGSDVRLNEGFIQGGTSQIHVAGGFGGLYLDQHLGYGGDIGLLIDESIVARGNRELFLSNQCVIDAQNIAHILVNATGTNLLLDCEAWMSGAGFFTANPGDGVRIQSCPNGRISLASGHLKAAKRDGLRVEDATTEIIVADDTFITDCLGFGVNATVATQNVAINGRVEYNTTGQIAANVSAFKIETPVVSSGGTGWAYTGTIKLRQQGNYLSILGEVVCTTLGTPSGAVSIALSRIIKTGCIGFFTNLNTGNVGYVRGEPTNTSITLQLNGGTYPFTASGQTIRFVVNMELSQ